MNKPYCLIGDINSAKEYIKNNYEDSNFEFLVLNNEITIEDIKRFRIFLQEPSINKKIGIIYAFNNLNNSKQSVLLKILESLPDNVYVILHSFCNVSFTVHTRCNIIYLSSDFIKEDWKWFSKLFLDTIKTNSLTNDFKNGMDIFFKTLHFYNIDLITKEEKNIIFESLR